MMQTSWTWAAACRRGLSHEQADIRLQDAFKCFVGSSECEPLVIVVSDGAGSAVFGGEAASLICRTITVFARKHFSASNTLPTDEVLQGWLDEIRNLLNAAAVRRNLAARDFAATLIVFISNGTESVVLHVGDGCAVIKDADTSCWKALGWPFHGEYASTTAFVTDEPRPDLSIVRHQGGIAAASVFSDGLERLALDLKERQPFAPFFESIIAPVASSTSVGKDAELSNNLGTFLGCDGINSRSDDDKTLVLAVRR
jgi:hypothetical protein